MKRIGFVDYYISEWHANNYPAWIEESNQKLNLDYKVAYAWAEEELSPVTGESTDEWCAKMGAEKCETLKELCEKSDVILILAPSNPEKHLLYAAEVLTYGKRTYIDKTFAPDLETAKEIFRIAEGNHTPFFSSSALRYAEELAEIQDPANLIVVGGGRNFEEYMIHLIEMSVSLLKSPAVKVKVEHLGKQRICHVMTRSGAKSAMIYSPALTYSVTSESSSGKVIHKKISSSFFIPLIEDILKFFEEGRVSFDGKETLEVIRLRDGILKAAQAEGTWIELD